MLNKKLTLSFAILTGICFTGVTMANVGRNDDDVHANEVTSYKCPYVCDSMTTRGMIEWADAVRRKEDSASGDMMRKMMAQARGDEQTEAALKAECDDWKALAVKMEQVSDAIIDLRAWTGGTIWGVVRADVRKDLAYVRRACISDDYRLIAGNGSMAEDNAKFSNDGQGSISAKIKGQLEELSIATQDTTLFGKDGVGTVEEYNIRYDSLNELARELSSRLKEWALKRSAVAKMLDTRHEGQEYRLHSDKVLESLADIVESIE